MKNILFKLATVLSLFLLIEVHAATILVGPTRAVKDLSKVADGNVYILDWQKTPYKFPGNIIVKNSLTLQSAQPNERATIQFPIAFKLNSSGVTSENNALPQTINCQGVCTMKDMKTVGGTYLSIFTTGPNAQLLVQHVDMDGGTILMGSGGKSVHLIDIVSTGRPANYFIANFNNAVQDLLVDMSARPSPIQQGGSCVGNAKTCDQNHVQIGEAAVRVMDAVNAKLIGLSFTPWLFDGKTAWKQVLQIRHSNTVEIENSNVQSLDVGNMTWENITAIEKCGGPLAPLTELKKLILTDDTIGSIGLHAGVREVLVQKTVNGKLTKVSDKTYSYTCPAPTGKCPFQEGDTKGCNLVSQ
jgi:hypothetical protein